MKYHSMTVRDGHSPNWPECVCVQCEDDFRTKQRRAAAGELGIKLAEWIIQNHGCCPHGAIEKAQAVLDALEGK